MKFLHTSDWHLGKKLHEHYLTADQSYALEQILDIIQSDDYAALIVAGDVFDQSIAPPEALDLFGNFLAKFRSVSSAPVVIIAGNHDSASRLAFCADVIRVADIHICADPSTCGSPIVVTKNGETARIYPIPFLHPHVFDAHQNGESVKNGTHNTAVEHAVSMIKQDIDAKAINICVAHFFATGGQSSDSERAFVGTIGNVDIAPFNVFDYTALGHLHRPQAVNERARYSGSLLKYSFSEANDVKGVLSIDLHKQSCVVTTIPIKPRREMRRLAAKFTQLMGDAKFAQFKDDYIEAELTDSAVITNAITSLKTRFPNILSVKQPAVERLSPEQGSRGTIFAQTNETAKASVEDVFAAFHSYVAGEEPSAEEKMLFTDILKEAETEENK